MGWLKRSVAALFVSAAALVGYNTTGNTQATAPAVVEERIYSKQQPTPDIANDARYKLANAATYALATTLITSAAGGVGYAVGQRRRNGYRPEELDDADRDDMPLVGSLTYDRLPTEEKTKVDAQLKEARIKAEQARETARKLKEAEDILGGKKAVKSLKNNTRITRQFSERTNKYDAPEYGVVVSQLVDNCVRHDFVGHGKSKASIVGGYDNETGQFIQGRFDITADQLYKIIEPFQKLPAIDFNTETGLKVLEDKKEQAIASRAQARAIYEARVLEEMRRAVVKL
ncbi:MAG: hypothetical protein HYU56_04790 [Candidatus Aenigmarchaeota archaeon]|nr:hypothetical protein [Candidatus Aenigmarchaeota archaeon]